MSSFTSNATTLRAQAMLGGEMIAGEARTDTHSENAQVLPFKPRLPAAIDGSQPSVGRDQRELTKRAFDLIGAFAMMLVALPLLALAALAIKLEDRGPVFYLQERVGRFGRRFRCLKLRSMRTDAERDGIARWASEEDDRVTRVGRVLRKYRVDELPQLFNVLRGEMSLVGPRPERPFFVEQLQSELPGYDHRHSVVPGITGWAQVNYRYCASVEDARKKLELDLFYVHNRTLFLDAAILLRTVRVVLRGAGL